MFSEYCLLQSNVCFFSDTGKWRDFREVGCSGGGGGGGNPNFYGGVRICWNCPQVLDHTTNLLVIWISISINR